MSRSRKILQGHFEHLGLQGVICLRINSVFGTRHLWISVSYLKSPKNGSNITSILSLFLPHKDFLKLKKYLSPVFDFRSRSFALRRLRSSRSCLEASVVKMKLNIGLIRDIWQAARSCQLQFFQCYLVFFHICDQSRAQDVYLSYRSSYYGCPPDFSK